MKPIAKGDMVMVTKRPSCCGTTRGMGLTYIVDDIYTDLVYCGECLKVMDGPMALVNSGFGFRFEQLIRVDPPPVEESIDTAQEIPA